jgi:hypothetical protein
VSLNILLVGSNDRQLEEMLRGIGMKQPPGSRMWSCSTCASNHICRRRFPF